jgi:hypothetical protein
MPFAAVLDASVLYPLPLRDTLLRVAEIELYDPYWSQRILDEVARNLIADARASEQQARNLIDEVVPFAVEVRGGGWGVMVTR